MLWALLLDDSEDLSASALPSLAAFISPQVKALSLNLKFRGEVNGLPTFFVSSRIGRYPILFVEFLKSFCACTKAFIQLLVTA